MMYYVRMEATPGTATCPECGGEYPTNPGYVAWCDRCGWNLLDSLYTDLGTRLGKSLYNTMSRAPSLRPRVTPSLLLALLSALVIHLLTLLSAVLGIYLLLFHWHNVFAAFLGLLCLGIFLVLAPRPNVYPKKAVGRPRRPGLYQVVDEVAAVLRAPRPAAIILSADFTPAIGAPVGAAGTYSPSACLFSPSWMSKKPPHCLPMNWRTRSTGARPEDSLSGRPR